MDATVRRSIDRGTLVEAFWQSHRITNPDLGPLLTQLTGLLARGQELAIEQRGNQVDRTAASAQKRELERTIRATHVPHLSQAGALAASDDPELGTVTFRLAPSSGSFTAFRAAIGTMAASAEQHRDALVKRGMGPSVLTDLGGAIKQFDLAVERGNKARAAHVEATAQLAVVAADIAKVVKMMDAIARLEFKDDPGLLATWKSVSRRQGIPQADAGAAGPSDSPTGPTGDVRPAA
jgi:hypothetical protein